MKAELITKKAGEKTKALNIYDNCDGLGCTWSGNNLCIGRALENVRWKPIIQGRFLKAGNVNAHILFWILHYRKKQNAAILEDNIKQFRLLVNNKPGRVTQALSKKILVIYLAPFLAQFRSLILWKILEKHPSFSDYKLIVL